MGAGETLNFLALNLLILPGILGDEWAVWYPEKSVCAVRGSTVVINCTYDYPKQNKVKETMWCHNHTDCIHTKYVCHSENMNLSSEYNDRAEFLGDKKQNCTLKLKNITDKDAGVYRFRFIIGYINKWTGKDGVNVNITALKVLMSSSSENGTIREGDSVNLTCATGSCSLSQSEFIWFKDKQRLRETHSTHHFSPVSFSHSGKYSCALKDGENRAEEVQLDVQYNPDASWSLIVVVVLLAVLAVVVIVVIYFKRRKTPKEDNSDGITQISKVNTTPLTEHDKKEVTFEDKEVDYASIQFNAKKSAKKPETRVEEGHADEVIYSSVSQGQ